MNSYFVSDIETSDDLSYLKENFYKNPEKNYFLDYSLSVNKNIKGDLLLDLTKKILKFYKKNSNIVINLTKHPNLNIDMIDLLYDIKSYIITYNICKSNIINLFYLNKIIDYYIEAKYLNYDLTKQIIKNNSCDLSLLKKIYKYNNIFNNLTNENRESIIKSICNNPNWVLNDFQ